MKEILKKIKVRLELRVITELFLNNDTSNYEYISPAGSEEGWSNSQDRSQLNSKYNYPSDLTGSLTNKYISNAGLVILPAISSKEQLLSINIFKENNMFETSHKERSSHDMGNDSMINLEYDPKSGTFLKSNTVESASLIHQFNEQYDFLKTSRGGKRIINSEISLHRNLSKRRLSRALSQLETKKNEIESLKEVIFTNKFFITKERFDSITDNLMIRKLNLDIWNSFSTGYGDTFSNHRYRMIRRQKYMLYTLGAGWLLFIIIIIVVWIIIIHHHSE